MSRFAEALRRAGDLDAARISSRDDGGSLRVFVPRAAAPPTPAVTAERARAPRERDAAEPSPLLPRGTTVADHLERFASDNAAKQFAREQYNRLAAALHEGQCARGIKLVLVTSAVPREGKTLTAANLALTLSESYQRRVLLIDADLRRPAVHAHFGIRHQPGLTDALLHRGPLPLTAATARLSILPAGDGGADPMRTLASDGMRRLIEDVRGDFDWVLIDTPPIGLLSDAGVLASLADGALLVALAGRTPYDAIQRAAEALGADRILGVVLNGVVEADLPHPYEHAYYGVER